MSYVGTVIMWSTSSIPTGWQICDGTNGTPNLTGYFVYGAAADGDIGTSGGAGSHSHTAPDTNNGGASHTHSLSGTTGSGGGSGDITTGSTSLGNTSHTHSYSGTTDADGGSHSHAVNNTSDNSHLPPFLRLYYIMCLVDTPYDVPANSIVMFYGVGADIPSGWSMVMANRFAYGASVDGDVGSETTASTHTHTQPNVAAAGHTHSKSGTTGGPDDTTSASSNPALGSAATSSHTHSYSFTTGSGGSHAHSNPLTAAASHLPSYKMLYYIKKS